MKAALLIFLCVFATSASFAAEPPAFELHVVSETPTPTTKEYLFPQPNGTTEVLNLDSTVLLDGAALKSVTPQSDAPSRHTVRIVLNEAGTKRFSEITELHRGRRLGIVVAGKLVSAPTVRETIRGGSLELSGNFTEQEAAQLAAKLNGRLLAADPPEEKYRYTFELTEGLSCEGSTTLKPEELNDALSQASTVGGFLQLEQYRTASGTQSTVGFVNPRYIVRFHLSPATPAAETKPSRP